MRCPATLVIVAVLTAACGSGGEAVVTSPLNPAPMVTVPPHCCREIVVGQEVQGILLGHGSQNRFELTASSTGTLVVRVMWERPASIEFWIGDRWVAQASSAPLVARIAVTRDEKYQLIVADAAAWDYDDFVVPFVLSTTIEATTP